MHATCTTLKPTDGPKMKSADWKNASQIIKMTEKLLRNGISKTRCWLPIASSRCTVSLRVAAKRLKTVVKNSISLLPTTTLR